jgi:phage-related protein
MRWHQTAVIGHGQGILPCFASIVIHPGRPTCRQYKILYNPGHMKPIEFRGDSLDCLREFPREVRREAGFQLDRVQRGLDPFDWKPMSTVGSGVREIRVRDESGGYRVLYVAKFQDAVYVLHCFQKKTQATPKRDIDLADKRYRELMEERR